MSNNTQEKVEINYRDTVVLLINSLRKNVDFKPIINDPNKIDSFKNYIFSRYIDKLTSVSANYIRIDWIITKLRFSEIDNIFDADKEKLNDESLIELIATILRPLTEIYLEIKSIELSNSKSNIDIETSCKLLYYNSVTEAYQLKRTISNEIYNCDPKYFKLWCDNNSKELNKIKQQFSEKNILLLKNVKNKYKGILENYGKTERVVLGFDYLTHYAIISKKTHFSYTNIPFSNLKPSIYLSWSLLYLLLIYEHLMKMEGQTDEIYDGIKPVIEHFVNQSSNNTHELYKVNDFVFVEYGVAVIKNIKDLTYEIEYYISNCFKTEERDFLPKMFLLGKVDEDFLEVTKKKYYPEKLKIYQDNQYDLFYKEIYEHSILKPIDMTI